MDLLWRVFEVWERRDWIRSSYLRGAILQEDRSGWLESLVIPGVLKLFPSPSDSFHSWRISFVGERGYNLNIFVRIV